MEPALRRVVVVGGGLGGLRAVESLRRAGFEGRIVLVGEEPRLPYDRPPLSKEVLTGDRDPETIIFRQPTYFETLDVDVRTGVRATGLDLVAREVLLDDERLGFDGIILATGATPRSLTNTTDLAGVHTLRTIDEAIAIRTELERGPRVLVVGAGFIGSEVAASARRRGLDVTVIETLPVPLVRAVGTTMGRVCASLHVDHGTRLMCGVGVDDMQGSRRVERVSLSDGTSVDTDLVVVGVGVDPAISWLDGSGLTLENGVVCDATLCAGPPRVLAVGDIARWLNPLFGMHMRVEHWTNAGEQAMVAARNLLAGAGAQPFRSVPYFWSDQYGVRIQLVGYPDWSENEVVVAHGSVEEQNFVALYRRENRVVAALGMNSSKLLMQYRLKIAEGIIWEPGTPPPILT